MPYLHSKKGIYISANIEKAELFDQVPTNDNEFWFGLLCQGGGRFDQVIVANESMSKPPSNIVYRWYSRTLFTMLVVVSGTILAHIF